MYLVLLALLVLAASAQKPLFLGLNEKCKNETEPWICKTASTCNGLKKGIDKVGEMQLCGFSGREPIICCPPEPEAGKKAEEKCREYAEYVYREIESPILFGSSEKKKVDECRITAETLIVGGSPANLNEFPHMALIVFEIKGTPVRFCGGSLISPNFILTAAHCTTPNNNHYTATVRLGELDLDEKNENAISVKVAQVINHPMYEPSKSYHDIALMKLEKEVELGPNIRPLCLQREREFKHKKAIASGWGYTSFGNNSVPSNILQKVELDITDDSKCVKDYGTRWPKVSNGIKPEIMLCSGGDKVRGKDTCQGDSGGPLQVAVKDPYCMYSLIGITSFGIGCGSVTPGVYTRVSAYVDWIENIVWP